MRIFVLGVLLVTNLFAALTSIAFAVACVDVGLERSEPLVIFPFVLFVLLTHGLTKTANVVEAEFKKV